MTSNKRPRFRVAVVGAGPAGLRAAQALADAGLVPTLINEAPEPGGQIYRRPPHALKNLQSPRELYGQDWKRAAALAEMFAELQGEIDYRPETLVWNAEVRPEGGFRLSLRNRAGKDGTLDVAAVVLATGAMDRVLPVPGWTEPGVWSLGGAQVMLKAQAQLIGRQPVFAGSGPLLYLVAWQYAKAGGTPAAIIDSATFSAKLRAVPAMLSRPRVMLRGSYMAADLRRRGVPVFEGGHAERIETTGHGLVVHWSGKRGGGSALGDAVAIGHGLKPERQLADLLGCQIAFDAGYGGWLAVVDPEGRSSVRGVYLAGDMANIRGAHAAETAGELAAMALLSDFGHEASEQTGRRRGKLRHALQRQDTFRSAMERVFPFPHTRIAGLPDDTIVCRCEGVSAGDLRDAITNWNPVGVNRLKAFTRCGMGRCQSRLCGGIAAGLLAAATGQSVEAVGAVRGQAPVKPLPGPVLEGTEN